KDIDRIVQEELSKFGKHVESVTKKLVHQDEGHLSDSINFDNAYKEGNSYIVSGGSNLPYALRRHEEPYRPGVHDKYLHGRHYPRSEEHTSELQSRFDLVCRLLLE